MQIQFSCTYSDFIALTAPGFYIAMYIPFFRRLCTWFFYILMVLSWLLLDCCLSFYTMRLVLLWCLCVCLHCCWCFCLFILWYVSSCVYRDVRLPFSCAVYSLRYTEMIVLFLYMVILSSFKHYEDRLLDWIFVVCCCACYLLRNVHNAFYTVMFIVLFAVW